MDRPLSDTIAERQVNTNIGNLRPGASSADSVEEERQS